ncbi:MAG: 4-hydroxythreonine-4-phosphate dehydrogenase PdxA [Alphaproteobacteria bacterium]|nr:4-hydroxythreonine-4-phosphate dehydrogenase PdxA [Alphaproteobacteria bacterium]
MAPLALTLGEPAGIGPDITLMAWHARHDLDVPPFYLCADGAALTRRAKQLGLSLRLAHVSPEEAAAAFPRALPVVETDVEATAGPGRPDSTSAPAAIASIRRAVTDVIQGRASAIVTNPIAKSVLYRAGFDHPGHTEFLAELAGTVTGGAPVMMLWSEQLCVVPVTIHVPLRSLWNALTPERITATADITAQALRSRFGIASPRLVIAGLNPHAGEDGALGDEEETILAPAIRAARAQGINLNGPFPADTLFHERARQTYDCALCIYHDQALIPIKTLAFDQAVNVTLGLNLIRTSPDHGTAFDIAGTGTARPDSLIAALRLAARMATV